MRSGGDAETVGIIASAASDSAMQQAHSISCATSNRPSSYVNMLHSIQPLGLIRSGSC